jgi:ribosomal protein L40E
MESFFQFLYKDTEVSFEYESSKPIEISINTGFIGDILYMANFTEDHFEFRVPDDDTFYFSFSNLFKNYSVTISYVCQFKSPYLRMELESYFLGILAFGLVFFLLYAFHQKYGLNFTTQTIPICNKSVNQQTSQTQKTFLTEPPSDPFTTVSPKYPVLDNKENLAKKQESKTWEDNLRAIQFTKQQIWEEKVAKLYTKSSIITKDGTKMQICKRCNGENSLSAIFCQNCGCLFTKKYSNDIVCPECERILPDQANYCVTCHKSLEDLKKKISPEKQLCPKCNQANGIKAKFCQRCGTKLKY